MSKDQADSIYVVFASLSRSLLGAYSLCSLGMHGAQLIRLASLDGMQRLNVSRLMNKLHSPKGLLSGSTFQCVARRGQGNRAEGRLPCLLGNDLLLLKPKSRKDGHLWRPSVIYSGGVQIWAGCSPRHHCAQLIEGGSLVLPSPFCQGLGTKSWSRQCVQSKMTLLPMGHSVNLA
jgi:hypothetical protein